MIDCREANEEQLQSELEINELEKVVAERQVRDAWSDVITAKWKIISALPVFTDEEKYRPLIEAANELDAALEALKRYGGQQ